MFDKTTPKHKYTQDEIENIIKDIKDGLEKLASQVIESENEYVTSDLIPTQDDIGCWVIVRTKDGPERGPYLLTGVSPQKALPYLANGVSWHYAWIVPTPLRGLLLENGMGAKKPSWLADDDEVLVEFNDGVRAVRAAGTAPWDKLTRYQKLDIKHV